MNLDMDEIRNNDKQEAYWSCRYSEARTGWDIGSPSTPIISYVDQLLDKDVKILIPGAGNAYEAEYLFENGFRNVYVLDIAEKPIDNFRKRMPGFPDHQVIHDNFFNHSAKYDLIIEQTFFCSFPPTEANRRAYAKKMNDLLSDGGKLVGLWFDIPLQGDMEKRPFGGDRIEYLSYFEKYFVVQTLEKCYNSIPPRADAELFGIFRKRSKLLEES